MQDLVTMWSNTRMVVLTAICAALYAGLMLPFKIAPIIPGFSEIRPGIAIPVTCSFLFGPAAAWGSALGNVIGDMWGGTIGPGSFFGFFGNFLMGYVPYKFWHVMTKKTDLELRSWRSYALLIFICITASMACAMFIGWGLDIINLVPLRMLANVIAINNSFFTIFLGIPLTLALYKRVKQWGLYYADVMKGGGSSDTLYPLIGLILMIAGSIGGIAAINLGIKNPCFTVFVLIISLAAFLL